MGGAGLMAAWLVFSLVKKLLGLVLLGGVLVAGLVLWTNPAAQQAALDWVSRLTGG
jgi:hypothetical protein